MFFYPIYKAIKQRLSDPLLLPVPIPVYFYIGQYQPGKDNTSYTIPAIYIELPKNTPIDFYPKKLMSTKNAVIKIHYISYAPFKNADNAQQETAIAQHEATLKQIDKILMGWNVKDVNNLNLTEQFITDGASLLNFIDKAVVSILNFKTELYSRHLK